MPQFQTQTVTDGPELDDAVSSAHRLILCYDGSEDAKRAIERAGALFPGEHALVLTVWQSISGLSSLSWSGATVMADFNQLDRLASQDGVDRAEEGARLAREAGLRAEPLAVQADGSIWETIIETAGRRHASVIVLGSRGLTGLRSILLGSVSGNVVHHAHRPTLVVHRPGETA